MQSKDIITAGGYPLRNRKFNTIRIVLLAMFYVFAVAELFLSPPEKVGSNRGWALLLIGVGILFVDYPDVDVSTLKYVKHSRSVWKSTQPKPTFFPWRLYLLGGIYLFSLMILIFGGSLTNRVWAILMLTQFIIILSYVADDK